MINQYLPDTINQFVPVQVLVGIPAGVTPVPYTIVANMNVVWVARNLIGASVPLLANLIPMVASGGDIGFFIGPIASGTYDVYVQVVASPETPLIYVGSFIVGY